MTSNKQLQDLLDQVARGELDPGRARERLIETLREGPFEDIGFARIDHHRSIRQGFPEVILGLGKTPAQIAEIAAAIVRRGSTLLVTRASEAASEAVRACVPGATYYADAAIIAFRQQDIMPGKGNIVVAAAVVCDPGFRYSEVGARVDWFPVPGFRLAIEAKYAMVETAFAGQQVTLTKTQGARPTGAYTAKDQGITAVAFRAQRGFGGVGE